MANAMSPSDKPITKGQIGKFYDVLVNALVKSGLPSGPVQQVLATQGGALANQFVASVRTAVELIATMLTRTVTVDRTLTPQQVLDATSRNQYVDKDVLDAMPRGTGKRATLHLFKPEPEEYTRPGWISDVDLERAFIHRNFIPADPYSLAKTNQDDPALADTHPNGTHFKDADGNWCFVTFGRWDDKRDVNVGGSGDGWCGEWWFAGLREPGPSVGR